MTALEARHENVNCWPGDARDLHFLKDDSFDITLLFGAASGEPNRPPRDS